MKTYTPEQKIVRQALARQLRALRNSAIRAPGERHSDYNWLVLKEALKATSLKPIDHIQLHRRA